MNDDTVAREWDMARGRLPRVVDAVAHKILTHHDRQGTEHDIRAVLGVPLDDETQARFDEQAARLRDCVARRD